MSDDPVTGDRLTAREWASALAGGRLLGQRCADCDHHTAAPKAACARCGSRDLETVELPTEGTIYSVTTQNVTPAGFDAPYDVALIEVGEARVLGRLDAEGEIGDRVVLEGTVEGPGGDLAPLFAVREP